MKLIEKALKILTFIILIISFSYFVISIIEFIELKKSDYTFSKLYSQISKYSGIHKFMLAVLAAFLGLSRLRLFMKIVNEQLINYS